MIPLFSDRMIFATILRNKFKWFKPEKKNNFFHVQHLTPKTSNFWFKILNKNQLKTSLVGLLSHIQNWRAKLFHPHSAIISLFHFIPLFSPCCVYVVMFGKRHKITSLLHRKNFHKQMIFLSPLKCGVQI